MSLFSNQTIAFDSVLAALAAAAEPTRLRLLASLAEAELTVTELVTILGQSQPRISRHLKLLAEAGLVERHREGAWVFFPRREQWSRGVIAFDDPRDACSGRRDPRRRSRPPGRSASGPYRTSGPLFRGPCGPIGTKSGPCISARERVEAAIGDLIGRGAGSGPA